MVAVGISLRENVFPPVLTSKVWLCHPVTSFCSPDFIPDEVHLHGILKAYCTTKCTKIKEKWYQKLCHGKQNPNLSAQMPLESLLITFSRLDTALQGFSLTIMDNQKGIKTKTINQAFNREVSKGNSAGIVKVARGGKANEGLEKDGAAGMNH